MKTVIVLLALFSAVFAQDNVCDSTTCLSPDCQCFGSTPPGGLTPEEVPQIVWITFDDAMATEAIPYYKTILEGRKNPNGCNISLTFFLTHEYSNYSAVYNFWRFGSEFASNSISKIPNTTYWRTASEAQWEDEMLGMKEILNTYALIPTDDVQGMRAPYLQMGGDNMFEMVSNDFVYDCSWPSVESVEDPIYPYTLDYNNLGEDSTQDCPIGVCPDSQFPGVWEFPMVDMLSLYNNTPCSIVTACEQPVSQDDVYEFFMENFYRHFNSSRAPFGIFLSVGWFQADQGSPAYNLPGFLQFLDTILARGDTYAVTLSQTLQWMQAPVPLSQIDSFTPFSCASRVPPNQCSNSYSCYYPSTPTVDGGPRTMVSCTPCPASYPWVGNVAGTA